jgi:hypothetical protein
MTPSFVGEYSELVESEGRRVCASDLSDGLPARLHATLNETSQTDEIHAKCADVKARDSGIEIARYQPFGVLRDEWLGHGEGQAN